MQRERVLIVPGADYGFDLRAPLFPRLGGNDPFDARTVHGGPPRTGDSVFLAVATGRFVGKTREFVRVRVGGTYGAGWWGVCAAGPRDPILVGRIFAGKELRFRLEHVYAVFDGPGWWGVGRDMMALLRNG